jgi:small subunit ribosomal protein S16
MLIIRLQRTGKKNAADFRIVLAQKTSSAAKKFVEVLGSYNPRSKGFMIKDEERLKYWIAQHVEISPTMHNLLVGKNLLDAKKVRAFNTPKKPAEPVAATATPAAPAAEAATEAPAAAEVPVETPAVETSAETPATPEQPAA